MALVPEYAHAQRLALRGGAPALPAAELQRIVGRRAGAFLDLSTLQVSPDGAVTTLGAVGRPAAQLAVGRWPSSNSSNSAQPFRH